MVSGLCRVSMRSLPHVMGIHTHGKENGKLHGNWDGQHCEQLAWR